MGARALTGNTAAAFGTGSSWDIVQQVCDDFDMTVDCSGSQTVGSAGVTSEAMLAFTPVRESAFWVNQHVELVGGPGLSTVNDPVYATLSVWTASFQLQRIEPQGVPEPTSAVLALAALAALGAARRSRVG